MNENQPAKLVNMKYCAYEWGIDKMLYITV